MKEKPKTQHITLDPAMIKIIPGLKNSDKQQKKEKKGN